nr:MAG TPA: hypothetical protein [Caudoviricetes sp.]
MIAEKRRIKGLLNISISIISHIKSKNWTRVTIWIPKK